MARSFFTPIISSWFQLSASRCGNELKARWTTGDNRSPTGFREVHSSDDRLRLPIHVHQGCVQLLVPPAQERRHHLQALLRVSPTAERHGSEQRHRAFGLGRRHVSAGHEAR